MLQELYVKFFQEDTVKHLQSLKDALHINFSKDEVYRYLTCVYLESDNYHKRAFSKMKADILKEIFFHV